MNEYIIFMLDDTTNRSASTNSTLWAEYISALRKSGQFDGGSSIGNGERHRKGEPAKAAGIDVTGFIRVRAASMEDARRFLIGNPDYEAGGSVEIRELPKD
ncbi:hypothetical protein [Janthinobacterium fluminis]|uniref:YCII-related domain-containing protein n=1 Tax=Janthinobacterium fluminis TaxID=2987524 RepID=A0ABT5JW49_9BURK|nr:hypothetical protein [Janthinobacterium fluminis]MDC8756946.1 hypothetical protein [Janthinobacterium fluminis]